jgi:DNA (cytosine-5)-methyltransferase 1
MDTTKELRHISLCAGYGGIDLGLKRAIPNLRTIAFSEIEAYACANLVSKMEQGLLDSAPIWTNLKTFPWQSFRGAVDILSGGYPCQPFSTAGKRLGAEDPRHLWPFIANGIELMRPKTCFFENVEGHISMGLSTVISDLEQMGYAVSWGLFSASECGAPHRRKRVFILANASQLFSNVCNHNTGISSLGDSVSKFRNSGRAENLADTNNPQFKGAMQPIGSYEEYTKPGSFGSEWGQDPAEQAESRLGRMAYGDSATVDRLRLCGNGVVPATAELAFKTLFRNLTK